MRFVVGSNDELYSEPLDPRAIGNADPRNYNQANLALFGCDYGPTVTS